jgi:hypothetical protein
MTLTGNKIYSRLITDISGFILTTVHYLVSDFSVCIKRDRATNEAVGSQVVIFAVMGCRLE